MANHDSGNNVPLVLVVDDVGANRVILSNLVSQFGYRVETAADGAEALRKIDSLAPDLVLLDLVMPIMSGQEVLKTIAERQLPVAVIVFTMESDPATVEYCLSLGAFDYLVKPVDPLRLKVAMRNALCMNMLMKQAESQPGGETRFLPRSKMLQSFLTEDRKLIEIISGIEEAISADLSLFISGEEGCGKSKLAQCVHKFLTEEDREIRSYDLNDLLFEDSYRIEQFFEQFDTNERCVIELQLPSSSTDHRLMQTAVQWVRHLPEKPMSAVLSFRGDPSRFVESEEVWQDLMFQSGLYCIDLPPLREHPEDAILLFDHFIGEAAREFQVEKPHYDPGQVERLQENGFPKNAIAVKEAAESLVKQSVSFQA